MSIGNLKDQGNKGNNFPYQLGSLQLLGTIATNTSISGGLATEATLLQVLAAIQNGQEYEQNLVIDSGDPACGVSGCPTYLQVRIWDTVTHAFGPPRYFDANGTEFFIGGNPLYGPMVIVNPQYVLENILTQLVAINADLDVALSTRASEATLAALSAKFNSLGQKLMVASVPVVLASDQSSIPVTVASLPLPTGAATEATLAAIDAKLVQFTLNFGVATAALRVAAQIGNAAGSADFGSGAVSAQTIRTTLATDVALPAGENHLGAVGGNTGYVEVTMTLDTAIYATGDVLTDTVSLTDILRTVGGTGIIQSIHLLDEDAQGQAIDVVFFRTNVSLGTKNSPVSISDANAREILGVVNIATSDYVNLVNSYSVTKTNLGIGVKGDGLDDLFMSMICRSGTPTYTASGITVKVVVLQD